MLANLIWITPDADQLVGYMARVSNPNADPADDATKLINYLIKHEHWSPFEMVSACVEINTTRDIARQILRHRSFHFQEFSQRYAEVSKDRFTIRDVRLQDEKNRQASIKTDDAKLKENWAYQQRTVYEHAHAVYRDALASGVAKEVARSVLPEGMTESKMYMSGTIRDWLHYLRVRTGNGTQYEHVLVAKEILAVLVGACPAIFEAATKGGFDFGSETTG